MQANNSPSDDQFSVINQKLDKLLEQASQVDLLNKTIAELSKTITELRETITDLEQKNHNLTQNYKQLQIANGNFRDSFACLEQKNHDLVKNNQRLRSLNNNLSLQCDELTQSLDRLQAIDSSQHSSADVTISIYLDCYADQCGNVYTIETDRINDQTFKVSDYGVYYKDCTYLIEFLLEQQVTAVRFELGTGDYSERLKNEIIEQMNEKIFELEKVKVKVTAKHIEVLN